MKLKDLMALYDGVIALDIYKVDQSTGAVDDVISCQSEELDALKDDILDADVLRFNVKVENLKPEIEFYI